jgi:NADH-quinone oxidoreductase subunit I
MGVMEQVQRRRENVVIGHIRAIATAIHRALKPPITLMYPDIEEDHPEGYRGLIVYNYDRCIGCGLCARICPARAIKMYRVPGDKRLRPGYDMARCIFCGFCVDICPANALEHSWIHDKAYYELTSMVMDPIDWAKFSQKLLSEEEMRKRKVKRVRAVIDEEVGLRYEPV